MQVRRGTFEATGTAETEANDDDAAERDETEQGCPQSGQSSTDSRSLFATVTNRDKEPENCLHSATPPIAPIPVLDTRSPYPCPLIPYLGQFRCLMPNGPPGLPILGND